MLYKMRLYRNGNHEPVCEPFEITAEDIEQAREFAWDEYTGNHGDLVAIIEGDDRYVPVTDDKTHEGKQLYEFVLTDENGKDVEVGCPLVTWASDEENAELFGIIGEINYAKIKKLYLGTSGIHNL